MLLYPVHVLAYWDEALDDVKRSLADIDMEQHK